MLEWLLFIIPLNELHTYSRDRLTEAPNDNVFMKPSYYILYLISYRLCELQSLNTAIKKRKLDERIRSIHQDAKEGNFLL